MTIEPIKDHTPIANQFDKWWTEEGSGIPPLHGEDAETHVHRVSKIAWLTGVVKTLEAM